MSLPVGDSGGVATLYSVSRGTDADGSASLATEASLCAHPGLSSLPCTHVIVVNWLPSIWRPLRQHLTARGSGAAQRRCMRASSWRRWIAACALPATPRCSCGTWPLRRWCSAAARRARLPTSARVRRHRDAVPANATEALARRLLLVLPQTKAHCHRNEALCHLLRSLRCKLQRPCLSAGGRAMCSRLASSQMAAACLLAHAAMAR
jgi:hypothetical protein